MKPEKMIIHHSATADSGTLSWPAIRYYHVETNGWSAVGYHFGIEWNMSAGGGSYEMLVGRPLFHSGAHTAGMNTKSIGVCFVGDYDAREPPVAMLEYAAPRLAHVCRALSIPIKPYTIRGHRDYANKTCPGNKFDIERLIWQMLV